MRLLCIPHYRYFFVCNLKGTHTIAAGVVCFQRFKQLTDDECVVEYNTKRTWENQLNVLPLNSLPIHMPIERCTHTRTTICLPYARAIIRLTFYLYGVQCFVIHHYARDKRQTRSKIIYTEKSYSPHNQWPETNLEEKLDRISYDLVSLGRHWLHILWINSYGMIFPSKNTTCNRFASKFTVQNVERKKKPREYIHTAMAVSVIPYGAYDVFDISLKCTCIEWTRQS